MDRSELHGGPGMAYTYLDTLGEEIGDGYRVAAFQRLEGPFDVETPMLWPAYFASPAHTVSVVDLPLYTPKIDHAADQGNSGSSRTASKSLSPAAHSRIFGERSTASRRCAMASSRRPASASKQAVL